MAILAELHHRHPLYLRSPGVARAADHPAASRPALPHPGSGLFAEDDAGKPFHQLAAGSARQLAGAAGLPEPTDEFSVTVDLIAEMAVDNPFDFFIEDYAQAFPFKYADSLAKDIAADLCAEPAGPLLQDYLVDPAEAEMAHGRFPGRAQRRPAAERSAMSCAWSRACRRPRRRLRSRSGSCRDTGWLLAQILRHLGFAARFVSGYLIQLKRRPAGARRPLGHGPRFHRPARLGRGLYSRRRLDRPRSDLRPVRGRRPSAARRHAALFLRRADRRLGRAGAMRFRLRDAGGAARRKAARHRAFLGRSLAGAGRARQTGRRRSERARTCA